MPHRIYADFNALAGHGEDRAVILNTQGTLSDLARHRVRLSECLRLTFWDASDDDEDIEVDAEVNYHPGQGHWLGEFAASKLRYVPKRDRTEHPCVCFSCGADVTGLSQVGEYGLGTKCPACSSDLGEPLRPPEEAAR